MDALVRAIPARDVAQVATDALIWVDARDDLVIQIEMLPLSDLGNRKAAKIADGGEAFFIHPIGEPVDHVFYDAIAVMHRGRAYLHRTAAEQDELGGFAPA